LRQASDDAEREEETLSGQDEAEQKPDAPDFVWILDIDDST
jgi:hypothetical protein